MTIKLFAPQPMTYTPFTNKDGEAALRAKNITFTDHPKDADLFVTRKWNTKVFLEFLIKYRPKKPILIWTHEPRFCILSKSHIPARFGLPDVYIMNLYNRNVYFSNCTIYGYNVEKRLSLVSESSLGEERAKKVVALATYSSSARKQRLMIDGIDRDLVMRRQAMILAGQKRGIVDVYGKGWPKNVVLGESRSGDWKQSKAKVLAGYRFCICMENTDFDYYVSEKLWNCISGYCLPIYRGGGKKIYEDFAKDSFLDPDDFRDSGQLFDYIENMSDAEYCRRLNSCIDTYNKIWERQDFSAHYRQTIDAIIEKVETIVTHR
jgi:hypothetical protein